MQTLAQSGSTKTEPFHDLPPHPVHEEGPPHYGRKRETDIQHYCKSDDVRTGFKVTKGRLFCHPKMLQSSPARFKLV
jgi:hypothetical protein